MATIDFSLLTNALNNTNVSGVDFIIGLVVVALTNAFITRDLEKWKPLTLPVVTLWHIIGVRMNLVVFMISSIVFVQSTISIDKLGNIMQGISGYAMNVATRVSEIPMSTLERMKKRMEEGQIRVTGSNMKRKEYEKFIKDKGVQLAKYQGISMPRGNTYKQFQAKKEISLPKHFGEAKIQSVSNQQIDSLVNSAKALFKNLADQKQFELGRKLNKQEAMSLYKSVAETLGLKKAGTNRRVQRWVEKNY